MYRNGVRNLSFRVEALDGNVKKANLQPVSVSVNMDSNAEIKRTASLVIAPTDQIDWYKDLLRVVLLDDGEEKPIGVFLPQFVEQDSVSGGNMLQVEAYDFSILLQEDCITERLNLKQGTSYLQAIQDLMHSANVWKIIVDASDAVLQSDRDDWDIGTSKIQIINQLLSEISFRDVYFDGQGTARLQRYQPASAQNVSIVYRNNETSIIEPDYVVQSDAHQIPNIFIAVVSNPDLPEPLVAKYVNNNPMSKTSTTYTKRNKVKLLQVDNIATQEDLQNYVNRIAFDSMKAIDTIQFQTAINANHGVWDTVALHLPTFDGICTEIEWGINLTSMTMTHKAQKVVIV